tara:strand:- start:557 stop:712 length:156 start_codon:yes stop_codon:yes gene_type:complete
MWRPPIIDAVWYALGDGMYTFDPTQYIDMVREEKRRAINNIRLSPSHLEKK